MAIYRDHYGIGVRIDSRTITVSAHPVVSVQRLAAVARAENDAPIRLQATWTDADGSLRYRRYTRLQQTT